MKVDSIKSQQIYFKANVPNKKTYSAMKEYYRTIGDKKTAKMYSSLANKAKARLHNKNSIKAQDKILDYSEKMCEEALSWKENLQFVATQTRNTLSATKEALLGAFYGSLI